MQGVDKSDLMLLVQYMIPIFALVLGAQLGGGEGALENLARVVLGVVLVVISLQLAATWYLGELLLSSSAVLFGVYQHLQYVPVVLCGAFIIALYALWEDSRTHAWLLLAAVLVGAYAALSLSMLSLVLLWGGAVFFLLRSVVMNLSRARAALLLSLLILGSWGGFAHVSDSPLVAEKFSPPSSASDDVAVLSADVIAPVGHSETVSSQLPFQSGRHAVPVPPPVPFTPDVAPPPAVVDYPVSMPGGGEGVPRNLVERVEFWRFYIDGVQQSWQVFLFGHADSPDRQQFPSAHNYYLDFVYNFCLVAMLPVLLLTFCKVFQNFGRILAEPGILALTAVVAFLLLVDNFFKVGMRQPYPGIVTFFLWGFLLAWLSRTRLRKPTGRRRPSNRWNS